MKRLTNMTPYFIALAILLIGGAFALGVLYYTDKKCNETAEPVSDPLDGPLPVWLRVGDVKTNETGDRDD